MASCTISVVIPVFDRQQLGVRALWSACAQLLEGLEVIVVDDGSQPPFRVPEIDTSVPIRLIRLPVNSGASAARNAGIEAARGEWVALLDSDDYWLPLTLAPRLAAARQDRESSNAPLIAYAAGFVVKRNGSDVSDTRIPREASTPQEFVCGCWFAPGSTILFHKDVFERVGGYDTELARLEDYDWFLRFGLAGGRLKVWNDIAAVIQVEDRPPIPVLEAAARRIVAKYRRGIPSDTLSRPMARKLRAYLDVERASVFWYDNRRMRTLFCLARSFLRAPRFSIHVRRFWARASNSPVRDDAAAAPWFLGAQALNRGRCIISRGTLEVVTDPQSGGYSALVPLAVAERPDKPIRLRCSIEVIEGAVGVSAVTADCTMLAERVAGKPGHYQLDIMAPVARDVTGILVRNSAVTGKPSRARISSISTESCPVEALPRIRSSRPSRLLSVPLRTCHYPEQKGEFGALVTSRVGLDTRASAVLVIDAWESLGDRIAANIVDKLAPTLAALRASGMSVVHLSHDQSVHPLARPSDGDTVIAGEFMDTDFIADMFRTAGIRHLVYLGYYSNQCVLRRSLGILEMQSRGFDTILVRDASAASESAESVEGEWFHQAAVHFVEINGGKTTTAADLQAAVADALAGG